MKEFYAGALITIALLNVNIYGSKYLFNYPLELWSVSLGMAVVFGTAFYLAR